MKALVYHGPKKVSVDRVPDAKLEKLTDVVIKLTTTNICGSDLHMYEGDLGGSKRSGSAIRDARSTHSHAKSCHKYDTG
jgi:threonine dehydrogenase-like Zn-dependent dehydrogenase